MYSDRVLNDDYGLLPMVTVMLMTSLCWWIYVGDWFQMLVAESLCWRLFSLCWRFSQCIELVTIILNRSPTSQTCHQLIWSPTSVTNIDVALTICWGVSYRLNLSRILKPSSVANALGTKADELEKWRLSLLKTEKAIFRIYVIPCFIRLYH